MQQHQATQHHALPLPLDILVFAAHPDDAEIGMGGTIAKHTAVGQRVGIVDLTRAEWSSNGTPTVRQAEAMQASALLGLAMRENLQLPDRGLQLAAEHTDRLVQVIRHWRPRLVFAPYWIDRHPDHVRCSQMVEEALFNAKLRRYLPEQAAHQVERLYFYFIHTVEPADVVVDISDYHSQKMTALATYQSQFVHTDEEDCVPTLLNQGYLEQVMARDRLFGQMNGLPFAEGFRTRQAQLVDRF
jgi:bacillithiol biosynthesis deacetylase BshB1